MILNKRYDDSETLSPQFSTIYRTDYINDIPEESLLANIAEPYYIGYVDYRDFPRQYNLNQLSGDTTQITFAPVKENHSWGFIGQRGVSSFDYGTPQFYGWDNNNELYIKDTSENAQCYFLNDIIMANVNTLGTQMRIEGRVIYIETSYLNELRSDTGSFSFYHNNNTRAHSFGIFINTTIEEFASVYNGEAKYSFTFNWNGEDRTIQFGKSNYINDTVMKFVDGDYTVYITLTNFTFEARAQYAYGADQSGTITILPFYSQTVPEASSPGLVAQQDAVWVPHNANSADQRFHYNYLIETFDPVIHAYPFKIGSCIVGNYPLETLTVEDFKDAGFGANYSGIIKETMFIVGAGYIDWGSDHYYDERFYSQINLDDIWKATMGYNKIYNDPAEYSTTSTSYNQYISTSLYQNLDRPLLERENGRYPQDREFVAKLRDWQIPGEHLKDNEYDPADLPPYDPSPEPEPTDGEEVISGDSITPSTGYSVSTGQYTTQYALTSSQVAQFGRGIWAQGYAGYISKFANTLFNLSEIDNYVVSLKVFPFALGSMDSYTPIADPQGGIYYGAGFQPIPITGDFGYIADVNDMIDGGYIDVENIYAEEALNAEPYVSVECVIPFCGSLHLNTRTVLGKHLKLRYFIDYTTGDCTAYLTSKDTATNHEYLIGQRKGMVGASIAVSGNNAADVVGSIIQSTVGIASTGIGLLAGTAALGNIGSAAKSITTATEATSIVGATETEEVNSEEKEGTKNLAGLSLGVKSISPHLIGSTSGFGQYGQPLKPYLIIRYSSVLNPDNFGSTVGYRTEITKMVKDVNGFTVCNNVDVSSIGSATSSEKAKIKSILESGFYA